MFLHLKHNDTLVFRTSLRDQTLWKEEIKEKLLAQLPIFLPLANFNELK